MALHASPFPTIAAHRGGAALWPENSLTAFRNACELGVEYVEFDLHPSADGVLMVIHDALLDRTTTGTGPVVAKSREALSALRLRAVDEGIPTLPELLDLLKPTATSPRVEIKADSEGRRYPGLEQAVADELVRQGLLERALVSSFEWDALVAFRDCAEPAGLLALVSTRQFAQWGGLVGVIERAQRYGLAELALHRSLLEPDTVLRVQDAGLRVGLWGVDGPEQLEPALRAGITTFTTDIPDQALALRSRLQQEAAGQ